MLEGVANLVSGLSHSAEGRPQAVLCHQLAALGADGLLDEWGKLAVLSVLDTTRQFPSPDFFLEVARARAAPRSEAGSYVGRALWQIGIAHDERFAGARCIDHLRGINFFDLRNGTRVDISEEIVMTFPSHLSLCLLAPRNGLFNDFLPEQLYPRESFLRPSVTKQVFQDALIELQKVHNVSIDSIRTLVHTVALTGRLPIVGRTSYNCRMHYPGVAFIDAFQCNAHGICEALVHECIHQALWLDYATNSTDWFPLETATYRSPATGRELDVAVMVHAALVYSAISQLRTNSLDVNGAILSANWSLKITNDLRPIVKNHQSSLNALSKAEKLSNEVIKSCE